MYPELVGTSLNEVPRFRWCGMVVLDEVVSDVAFHGEAAHVFGIVPCKVDGGAFWPFQSSMMV